MMSVITKGGKNVNWTLDKIRDGFDNFYKNYGHYPTAHEVDDYVLLPSSRQIQRSFGGLVNLRKSLNLLTENYTKGEIRSKTASNINTRAKKYENIIHRLLTNKFDEKFIHIEKPLQQDDEYSSKDRLDFYVYAKPANFSVDVFGVKDERGVINVFNIKERKYRKSHIKKEELFYFVYIGDGDMNEDKLSRWKTGKYRTLPSNWKILNLNQFVSEIDRYSSYRAV